MMMFNRVSGETLVSSLSIRRRGAAVALGVAVLAPTLVSCENPFAGQDEVSLELGNIIGAKDGITLPIKPHKGADVEQTTENKDAILQNNTTVWVECETSSEGKAWYKVHLDHDETDTGYLTTNYVNIPNHNASVPTC